MDSNIQWQWLRFDQMTPAQMEAMFSLRQAVFIVEQDCIYLDIDGKDDQAIHLLGWVNNQLIATLRVFESYREYQSDSGETRASIGRICIHANFRNAGSGQQLVGRALDFIRQNFNNKPVKIGAQLYLKQFYEKLGFRQVSDIYDEDGIDHIHMLLKE